MSTGKYMFSSRFRRILTIRKLTVGDAGVYRCEATYHTSSGSHVNVSAEARLTMLGMYHCHVFTFSQHCTLAQCCWTKYSLLIATAELSLAWNIREGQGIFLMIRKTDICHPHCMRNVVTCLVFCLVKWTQINENKRKKNRLLHIQCIYQSQQTTCLKSTWKPRELVLGNRRSRLKIS